MPVYRLLLLFPCVAGLCSAPGNVRAAAFPCSEQGILDAVALGGGILNRCDLVVRHSAIIDNTADNRGSTATHALLAGGPAIDGGLLADCPLQDQCRVSCPDGAGCDTGAVEFVHEPSQATTLVASLTSL